MWSLQQVVGLTWRLRGPRVGVPRQEEEATFKAWARKCPSVTSTIFYRSRSHRACDGNSDQELGAIFNVTKVGIKIFTPRTVRIKVNNA